jgi:hypothetical protein
MNNSKVLSQTVISESSDFNDFKPLTTTSYDFNQDPLGSQFNSYELNSAVNHYLLDPYQYSITKFKYANPNVVPGAIEEENLAPINTTSDPNGLKYKGINFEELLPAYTASKKSENSYRTADYHRFMANNGFFNPKESLDNSDLWYYGADKISERNFGISGPTLNVQELNHIIFPEPQRGGLNSANLAKYSWENTPEFVDKTSWQAQNSPGINNDENCQFFNYNNSYTLPVAKETPFDKVYSFDSNYTRSIGISSPSSGSMPFAR